MYTNSRIISTSSEQDLDGFSLSKYLTKYGILDDDNEFLKDRFSSSHSQLYAALFICLLILYLLQEFIIRMLARFLLVTLTCSCLRKASASLLASKSAKDHSLDSKDIFKELDIHSLTELYKRCSRELNEYKEMVKA